MLRYGAHIICVVGPSARVQSSESPALVPTEWHTSFEELDRQLLFQELFQPPHRNIQLQPGSVSMGSAPHLDPTTCTIPGPDHLTYQQRDYTCHFVRDFTGNTSSGAMQSSEARVCQWCR